MTFNSQIKGDLRVVNSKIIKKIQEKAERIQFSLLRKS